MIYVSLSLFSYIFFPITLEDFNLKGKVKELIKHNYKNIYYFNESGYIIKYESYSTNSTTLKIKSEYIYKDNNILIEIKTIKNFNPTSTEKDLLIYDENNKLIEVDHYTNDYLFYKYFIEYNENYYKIKEYKYYANKIYKPRYSCYYIHKFEKNNLIELNQYSIKDKLLYSNIYKYNVNNYVSEILIKNIYSIKNEVLIYEYKYDNIGNIIEKNTFVRVTKNVKRILSSLTKSYTYY